MSGTTSKVQDEWVKRFLGIDMAALEAAEPALEAPALAVQPIILAFNEDEPPLEVVEVTLEATALEDLNKAADREKYVPPKKAAAPGTGMKSKPVGPEFAGEHNMVAHRAGTLPPPPSENEEGWEEKMKEYEKKKAEWEKKRQDPVWTTKVYSDKERADATLKMREDGSFELADGTKVAKDLGYVMDPVTGKMATFQDRIEKVVKDGEDVIKERLVTQQAIKQASREHSDVEFTHLSSVLGADPILDKSGKPVLDARGRPIMKSREAASAGFITFNIDALLQKSPIPAGTTSRLSTT